MGARRRRINKARLGIFDVWSGGADEEGGNRPPKSAVLRSQQIGGIPWAVYAAWAVVALVLFVIVKFPHILA